MRTFVISKEEDQKFNYIKVESFGNEEYKISVFKDNKLIDSFSECSERQAIKQINNYQVDLWEEFVEHNVGRRI